MRDEIIAKNKWEFDAEVTNCFEDMLERSIPYYALMRKSIIDVASFKIDSILSRYDKEILDKNPNGFKPFSVLDIGCSDGLQIESFINKYGDLGKYLGIDISEPMLEKARNRFKKNILNEQVKIEYMDLRYDFPSGYYDIITSILSIQFTPIEYRQEILSNIYKSLSTTGVFIMVEKVLGENSTINNMFVNNYYNLKKENGYTQEQIDRKKNSLEGVLVPCTNKWNIELLKQAGFKQVDVFWRWMNFVGYVAIK